MKYLPATAAVLALTSVSATGAERYQPDDPEGARVVPPAEYDKPFVGGLEEFIAKDLGEMENFCWGVSALGCARHWPASESGPPLCDIYIAPDELIRSQGLTTEIVRRHEIAHCNGWHHPPVPDLMGPSKYGLNAKGAGRGYRWTSRSVRSEHQARATRDQGGSVPIGVL